MVTGRGWDVYFQDKYRERNSTLLLCTNQYETSTSPPGNPPGIRTFEVWVVQISIPRAKKGVQMPHLRAISGDQMPLPLGHTWQK